MNRNNEQPESGKLLGTIPKKEPHTAPQGYFDDFAETLRDRIQSAPTLYAIEKKELFEQPGELYHEQLHNRVMARVRQEQAKKAKIVPMSVQLLRWSAVAAALVLVFTVGYRLMGGNNQAPQSTAYTDPQNPGLTHEDCQHYLENELNMDDAIAYYVNENVEVQGAQQSAEVDYLMQEEDIELEQY